ncbi:MAG TPA: type II toxin-antitoxin system VapC family toxin [Caldilineaceae bacterium]|nr:type II toxin-antitoxin system VapC family toxin [Caldilineaceae bacterium]
MPPLVVDASLVFRLLVPNPSQAALRSRVDGWVQARGRLAAPSLWLYELTSALVKAVHFGQLSDGEARQALALAHRFPVELVLPDSRLAEAAYAWGRRLQRANAYDAFYLALAEALGAELWTTDRRLARAAQQPWVQCLV